MTCDDDDVFPTTDDLSFLFRRKLQSRARLPHLRKNVYAYRRAAPLDLDADSEEVLLDAPRPDRQNTTVSQT